jgi:flagellar biosynthesis/type III secretory pathway chaperone
MTGRTEQMTTSTDNLSALLNELQQVLEEERAVLLSGKPERVTVVVERKLILAGQIEHECAVPGIVAPSIAILSRLSRYNRENSVICSSILQHLTRAIDKLRRHELHRSYGPDGTEQSTSAPNQLGAA